MKQKAFREYRFKLILFAILLLQLFAAIYFCNKKQGFHYDEYYSYYSSNVTYGLVPTDEEWKSTEEIKSEFQVAEDEKFSYGMVALMQSYDVHPPLYYFVLHTVCSLTSGIFSKWQGLSVNLVFFTLTFVLVAKISGLLTDNKKIILSSCLLYGFSPAVLSGVTFIRMYMMLCFFCLLFLYLHCEAIKNNKRTLLGFYVPIILTMYLGFLTHYYFIVFAFFIGCCTFFSLLFISKSGKHTICYTVSMAFGLLLALISYPSSLAHIFRGYRGTEARDAFFDFSNLGMRLSFFTGLLNEYLLAYTFYIVILIILLLFLAYRYNHKGFIISSKLTKKRRMLWLTFLTVGGYYLVVAKTALLNAEEATRYEMPVYGLIIVLCTTLLYYFIKHIGKTGYIKVREMVFFIIILFLFASQIFALSQNKVLFLYESDKENYSWAKTHANSPIVYIYSDTNKWMIWDESEELMQYDEIYFINMNHENLKNDSRISRANEVYVYAARSKQSENILMTMLNNYNFNNCKKIRELLYCDLYMLYK